MPDSAQGHPRSDLQVLGFVENSREVQIGRRPPLLPDHCRWDNDLIANLPTESSFMGQNVSSGLHHFWLFILHIKLGKDTGGAGRVNIWIFKSDPNLVVNIS